jgi:penicillin-binding protein 1A
MGARTSRKRVEPSFDASFSDGMPGGMFVSEDDRVVANGKKRSASSSSRQGQRRSAPAPKRERKSGGRRGGSGGSIFMRLIRGGIYWSLVLCLWGGIAATGLVVYYAAQMPSATTWAVPDRPPNVRIVSMEGQLVANRGMTGGEAVGLHEMSPFIPQAVVAIEDRRFHSHFGIDPIGLGRAMTENLMAGRISQGGSTLTQQLAKNLFLTPARTIERKIQEVLMAVWLEHSFTKDQILEMYLNRVYFGSGAYGVEAASRRYFGKSARDVNLSEAALLAGLLQAPSRLSPARDPQAAERRSQLVLSAMHDQGMINDSQMAMAMSSPPVRATAYWTGSEHYFADKVMSELRLLIGEVRQDIVVETTVDLVLQTFAEKSIRDLIDAKGKEHDVSQAALVSIDGSGAVRAMVGGYDYANSQFDRASGARRQPGSAFKPFVFMAALEQGQFPDSIRNDRQITIGNWSPRNYGDRYFGEVTLSHALARSLNSVAVQLANEVGPAAIVETAWRMGIESDLTPNLSIALGTSEVTPLELTAAYVPFANGGYRPDIHFVRRILSADGEVLYQHRSSNGPRVARPEVIGMMNAMMAETVSEGTARRAAFGWPAAGKTGTTQNARDAWFVGYTSNLTTGVWFGNDDGKPTRNLTGGSLPAEAWNTFMAAAHEGVPVADLPGGWNGRILSQIEDLLRSQDDGETIALPVDDGNTAAIEAPRPSEDVGGAPRTVGSILDVIFGN